MSYQPFTGDKLYLRAFQVGVAMVRLTRPQVRPSEFVTVLVSIQCSPQLEAIGLLNSSPGGEAHRKDLTHELGRPVHLSGLVKPSEEEWGYFRTEFEKQESSVEHGSAHQTGRDPTLHNGHVNGNGRITRRDEIQICGVRPVTKLELQPPLLVGLDRAHNIQAGLESIFKPYPLLAPPAALRTSERPQDTNHGIHDSACQPRCASTLSGVRSFVQLQYVADGGATITR